ncbi:MAG: methyltransferase domain-containing protein [Jatrophihabitans sp.]|nr:MAG: methyltransferase domain-containing protein [Jatrophihabitans sp.]
MADGAQWETVDRGWGRLAADFAALFEPANVREYAALHHLLAVSAGDRLLDVACGSGLAIELAGLRGAACAGLDASGRLVAIARDRSPDADIRVGDMAALPWPDERFDVVTSFRGIWATTPGALTEAHRVLRRGGRFGLTAWGHLKRSPGAWALAPLGLAEPPQVQHQSDMNQIGRPGRGEQLLAEAGFVEIERHELRMVWEFADPAHYVRAIGSSGPAYEAIQAVGRAEFETRALELAAARVRDGLPLRAEIHLAGFTARRPG